jgi:hypothetical protein
MRHERPARLTKSLLGHQREPCEVHRRAAAIAAKAYFNRDQQELGVSVSGIRVEFVRRVGDILELHKRELQPWVLSALVTTKPVLRCLGAMKRPS